jgi:hypothetical protein
MGDAYLISYILMWWVIHPIDIVKQSQLRFILGKWLFTIEKYGDEFSY